MHKSLSLNSKSSEVQYLFASRKRQSILPPGGLLLGNCMLEQVHSYRYLGILVTSSLTWKEHIKQICTKARKLVGMLHRKFSTWTDTNTLRCLYLTCIRPHLEYACQLWDPYSTEGIYSLESVQKFACRVYIYICLKQWNLDYDSMLELLDIPLLAARRKYLKLTTMYNIVHNNLYFPTDIFVQHNFPYSSYHHISSNFVLPFARTQYLFSSFVPSVITAWNSLPYLTKHSLSIFAFKRLLQHHFFAICYSCCLVLLIL